VFSDTTGQADVAKTNELVDLYQQYYRKYPTDTIAPTYIYNVATILMNTGKAQLAADWLDTLLTNILIISGFRKVYFSKDLFMKTI